MGKAMIGKSRGKKRSPTGALSLSLRFSQRAPLDLRALVAVCINSGKSYRLLGLSALKPTKLGT